MIKEIWKRDKTTKIKRYVSNWGRFRIGKKIYLGSLNKESNYRYVRISGNKQKLAHIIVALHFVRNKHNKKQVNHINGIKTDNSAVNLEWVTAKENMQHASKIGLLDNLRKVQKKIRKRAGNIKAKLTEKDIEQIRRIKKNTHYNGLEISKAFGIVNSQIYKIINNQSWKEESYEEFE